MSSEEIRADVAVAAMRTIADAATSEKDRLCAYLLEEAVFEAVFGSSCYRPARDPQHRADIVQSVQRLSNELAALVGTLREEG